MKPIPMTTQQLTEVLEDMAARVKEGDSFEGSLEYAMPDEGDPEGAEFMVQGAYRVGNTMGQGGMRLIGDTSS